jgi:hypothetical protein
MLIRDWPPRTELTTGLPLEFFVLAVAQVQGVEKETVSLSVSPMDLQHPILRTISLSHHQLLPPPGVIRLPKS